MIGLDTNVLVRYLTRDDEKQWQNAATEIEQNQPCLVTNIVLSELVWVLRGSKYNCDKHAIINVLNTMLRSPAFEFENRSLVDQALQQYERGKADFSDYLIGVTNQNVGCHETISFDAKLNGETGFRYLS